MDAAAPSLLSTGPLQPPIFNGTVVQCQPAVISWQGGEFPVRVQAFYQKDSTADWKNAGLPSEAADTNVLSWTANVPAGSYAWITLVDHSGTYKQSSSPAIVESSDDSSCLEPSATAAVVTQTVYMAQNGSSRNSRLDDRSLLITAIVFGILFFAAAAGALFLYSLLRGARKARFSRGGPRFDIADDEDDAASWTDSSARGSLAVAGLGAAAAQRYRKTSQNSDSGNAGAERRRLYGSIISAEKAADEKAVSPTSTHGEHNPFLDPPASADGTGLRRSSTILTASTAGLDAMPSAMVNEPSFQVLRPSVRQMHSHADTLSSATSMQLFPSGTGGLRVTNDPANISTPMLSRQITSSSSTTSESIYPGSTSIGSHERQQPGSDAPQRAESVHSHSTHHSVATSNTADHYESEPQSSKGWLSPQINQHKR